MVIGERTGAGHRVRKRYTVDEKRRIVDLTFESGASVAQVAQANGLNANQLFTWRRAFDRGELTEVAAASSAFLPVIVSSPCESAREVAQSSAQEVTRPAGEIHIEFPGRAMIRVEIGADPILLRSILESLRK
jgi:transposase